MGDILVKSPLIKTRLIDAYITLLDDAKPINKNFDALLYTGTYKAYVKISLLDKPYLKSNESALVQIELLQDWYFFINEKFILRNSSSDMTIGGGFVIDPQPLTHRKKPEHLIQSLMGIVKNKEAYIIHKLKEKQKLLGLDYFQDSFQIDKKKLVDTIEASAELSILKDKLNHPFVFLRSTLEQNLKSLKEHYKAHIESHPLDTKGVGRDQLKSFIERELPFKSNENNSDYFSCFINDLESTQKIVRENNLWRFPEFEKNNLSSAIDEKIQKFEKLILDEGMLSVSESRIYELAEDAGIPQKESLNAIKFLASQKKIRRFEKYYVHYKHIHEAKSILTKHFQNSEDGLTVAAFRDLLKGNRRIALHIFEYYEREKLIFRDGDLRLAMNI